ncbi:MAG TPA: cytidylate kinase-like family protein [Candidatus Pullilachnospira intestinigallinarum]|nr:cytidylate kinase-like family protein [Candidatus Pullilachnospira intestinigallinarum]
MRIITISREFGSGGRELGKRLADALGFSYYDKEIISAIAKESNFDENYVEETLMRGLTPNYTLTFGHTFAFGPDPIMQNELKILNLQQEIIRELAKKGDCVMVGRTSGSILEEDFHPLKIFVYADLASRLERCRSRADASEHLTDRELEKKIRQIDEGRARHQRLFTDKKWGARENYHLCINTTGLNIRDIIPSVKNYALAWFAQSAPKS